MTSQRCFLTKLYVFQFAQYLIMSFSPQYFTNLWQIVIACNIFHSNANITHSIMVETHFEKNDSHCCATIYFDPTVEEIIVQPGKTSHLRIIQNSRRKAKKRPMCVCASMALKKLRRSVVTCVLSRLCFVDGNEIKNVCT